MDIQHSWFSVLYVTATIFYISVSGNHMPANRWTRQINDLGTAAKTPEFVQRARGLPRRLSPRRFFPERLHAGTSARRGSPGTPWRQSQRFGRWSWRSRVQDLVARRMEAYRNQQRLEQHLAESHKDILTLRPSPVVSKRPIDISITVTKPTFVPKATLLVPSSQTNRVQGISTRDQLAASHSNKHGKIPTHAHVAASHMNEVGKISLPITNNVPEPELSIVSFTETGTEVDHVNNKLSVMQVEAGTGANQITERQTVIRDSVGFKSTMPVRSASIKQLLNERQPVIKDKTDEAKLKYHLAKVSEMQRINGLEATNERLIKMQLEYIDTIQEPAIKREVLKMFVKDIVEKSGFLTRSQHTDVDIQDMTSLLDLIKSISSRPISTTPMPVAVESQAGALRERINAGLDITMYQRSVKSPEQLPGVNLDHLVGLTIYGDRPRKSETRPRDVAIVDVTTKSPTSTFDPNLEPLGGNGEYWTHLTAGFQDFVCALCQRQNKTSCIVRYCQNDTVVTEVSVNNDG